MFTKQQTNAIAEMIYEAKTSPYNLEGNIDNIANRLSNLFGKDNPRFNSYKFLEVCGYDDKHMEAI